MSSVEQSEILHPPQVTAPPGQGVVTLAGLPATAPTKDAISPTERMRRSHRNKMRRLLIRLFKRTKDCIKPDDYAKLKISVEESLDLKTTVESCFFTPYPDALPPADDDLVGREYLAYDFRGFLPFGTYGEHRPLYDTRNTTWELWTVAHKAGYPHLRCIMNMNVDEGDDRLLRVELLNIARLTLWYLESDKFTEHVNIPILMLSVMGPQHGRFLQAYFQEKKFVIKYSELYNFKEKDPVALQLFARWALAIPVGNTKLDETQGDSKDQTNTEHQGVEELEDADMGGDIEMEEDADMGGDVEMEEDTGRGGGTEAEGGTEMRN
ncbi:hypothetical protein B7463_g3384, partial [Scytalidium lignicola]